MTEENESVSVIAVIDSQLDCIKKMKEAIDQSIAILQNESKNRERKDSNKVRSAGIIKNPPIVNFSNSSDSSKGNYMGNNSIREERSKNPIISLSEEPLGEQEEDQEQMTDDFYENYKHFLAGSQESIASSSNPFHKYHWFYSVSQEGIQDTFYYPYVLHPRSNGVQLWNAVCNFSTVCFLALLPMFATVPQYKTYETVLSLIIMTVGIVTIIINLNTATFISDAMVFANKTEEVNNFSNLKGFRAKFKSHLYISVTESQSLILKVPFFRDADEQFIAELAMRLESETFLEEDIICEEGEWGDKMFFIVAGKVEVISPNTKRHLLSVGAYFGESALLNGPVKRKLTAKAYTQCSLLSISKSVFDAVLSDAPVMKRKIQKIAAAKLAADKKYYEDQKRREAHLNASTKGFGGPAINDDSDINISGYSNITELINQPPVTHTPVLLPNISEGGLALPEGQSKLVRNQSFVVYEDTKPISFKDNKKILASGRDEIESDSKDLHNLNESNLNRMDGKSHLSIPVMTVSETPLPANTDGMFERANSVFSYIKYEGSATGINLELSMSILSKASNNDSSPKLLTEPANKQSTPLLLDINGSKKPAGRYRSQTIIQYGADSSAPNIHIEAFDRPVEKKDD
ncbi:hypothetical protein HK103_002709 [Boothiomyces macroporosus]|uniref:Cyclic nucleotide-binding domain-containing protein n=1 Tax=Boothiomyces macroporosus TaxID=261099 RepID=A0AAD5UQ54_9FUNG|nr:hypothetical protein HK103_002709 [Boothiomyces macroporosus]